jgi:hypothetical protein
MQVETVIGVGEHQQLTVGAVLAERTLQPSGVLQGGDSVFIAVDQQYRCLYLIDVIDG